MNVFKKAFSVRLKIVIIVFINILTLIFLIYGVSTAIISSSYARIEKEDTLQNLQRSEDALQDGIRQLSLKLSDWAFWDDTYKFIQDKNKSYIESNLGSASIANVGVNMMVFLDIDGNIVFKKVIDLDDINKQVSAEEIGAHVLSHKILTSHNGPQSYISGLVMLESGPVMLVSKPILTSNAEGPIKGTLIFVKYLNESVLSSVSSLTHNDTFVFDLNSEVLPKEVLLAKNELSKGSSSSVQPISEDKIAGLKILKDIYGNPILILKTDSGRNVYNQGHSTMFYFLAIAGTLILVFGLFLVLLIQKFLVSRLMNLGKEVEHISSTGDLSVRVKEGVRDEIGRLAVIINNMLGALSLSKEIERETIEKLKMTGVELEKLVAERTKELTSEKSRLIASINSIPFGFLIADVNNKIVLRNNIMTNMFKLEDKKDIYLEDIGHFLSKDLNIVSSVELCMRGKTVCEVKQIIFDNKILRGIIAPILNIEDGAGSSIGYVFMLEDVTDIRAMERSRDEFFSIASHELRTPLAAIRGNSQMLKDDYITKLKDKDMSEMIDDIHDSSIRLTDIVNDFLEVSRLEQGRVDVKKDHFDISEVIENVMKDLHDMAHSKGVKIKYEKPKGDQSLMVFSDKSKVQQVLFNLLGNSLKFTNQGEINIRTDFMPNFLKISIKDTGIGISEENQTLLFRKFQQAGEQVLARDVTKGTGLGLYICHMLVSKLGGTIGLEESTLGKGSTFAFTLPIHS